MDSLRLIFYCTSLIPPFFKCARYLHSKCVQWKIAKWPYKGHRLHHRLLGFDLKWPVLTKHIVKFDSNKWTCPHFCYCIYPYNSYNFLSKMSALNKTESQIWRQYMNLSLHSLSLSPNCHYDHVLFFRPSLWVLMRYNFDTWKGSF